ncbi:thiamine-triphosphatase [Tiliqua scincoides]|uniref:thiamine-triphosphatase n=1 Tax=Tiliqua scincoides TaxID=71010 RepID=UPI003462C592
MAGAVLGCNEPAVASSASHMEKDTVGPASAPIEVEQRFLYGPGIGEKLAALGATLQGTVSFRDKYYDMPDWRLTLADHWLREREGVGWELKCPPQSLEGGKASGCVSSQATEPQPPPCLPRSPSYVPDGHQSQHPLQLLEQVGRPGLAMQYREVTCPLAIVAQVCRLLGAHMTAGWCGDVAKAVEELGLEEFASFVTRRRKYHLGDLSVDLDEADFGYAVGELEAVVGQEEDVPEALKRIQKLGCQLGFDEKARIPGKMSAYLHKFRPAHYDALLQARRLQKVASTETLPPGPLQLALQSSSDEKRA